MKAAPLLPGDTIGVMSPSSYVEREDIEKSATRLEALGYKIFIHPQTFARQHQSAGTRSEKLEALHALYVDPAIKAIWTAGGGNRALYLLDAINYELIRSNPKPLIGFSDITAPLNAITAQTGAIGVHAQVFKNLHKYEQLSETLAILGQKSGQMPLMNAQIIQDGYARGRLVGGNLSLFHLIAGTSDCPVLENSILFLEDCSDEISRFDRMFAQLRRLGAFKEIGGLVLGQFTDMQDGARPFGFGLYEIIVDCLDGRHIPVVFNAPFGHGAELQPLPVGAFSTLDTKARILSFE